MKNNVVTTDSGTEYLVAVGTDEVVVLLGVMLAMASVSARDQGISAHRS
jgi:hypothetical protein